MELRMQKELMKTVVKHTVAKDIRLAVVAVEPHVDHQAIRLLHNRLEVVSNLSRAKESKSEEVDQNCYSKCNIIF